MEKTFYLCPECGHVLTEVPTVINGQIENRGHCMICSRFAIDLKELPPIEYCNIPEVE